MAARGRECTRAAGIARLIMEERAVEMEWTEMAGAESLGREHNRIASIGT